MFRYDRSRGQGGFTLIELLVVILIIAILAAIAIPVFLRQREKGWISQTRSALRNASIAAESYATTNDGDFAGLDGATSAGGGNAAFDLLVAEGLNRPPYFSILNVEADQNGYCIIGQHSELDSGSVWKIASVQSDASDSPTPTTADTCS